MRRTRGRGSDRLAPRLYDKVNRTEPDLLRALVRGSAARLVPVMTAATSHPSLPGYALRVLDGNHLPGSDKRLKPLRALRGAALPGLTLVVYDPDTGLAVDLVAAEDAYADERTLARALLDAAAPGQVWVADRHFCVRTWLEGWVAAGSHFVVRQLGNHPAWARRGSGRSAARARPARYASRASGWRGARSPGGASRSAWRSRRRRAIGRSGCGATCPRASAQHRSRRCIGDAGGSRDCSCAWRRVLHSEAGRLGRPRAALLGFAAAVLAHNVLSLLSAFIEQVHGPEPRVSVFHLGRQISAGYEGLMVALGHGPVLTGQEMRQASQRACWRWRSGSTLGGLQPVRVVPSARSTSPMWRRAWRVSMWPPPG